MIKPLEMIQALQMIKAPFKTYIGEALRPVPPTLNYDDDDDDDDDADVGQSLQGCFLGSLRSALGNL